MNYLGEYKRLTSAFEIKTKREVIINDDYDNMNNEYGSENKLDDDSMIFDSNNDNNKNNDNNNNNNDYDYDHIEAKNEQIKRLQHLQNLAGDAGEIPGKFRIIK